VARTIEWVYSIAYTLFVIPEGFERDFIDVFLLFYCGQKRISELAKSYDRICTVRTVFIGFDRLSCVSFEPSFDVVQDFSHFCLTELFLQQFPDLLQFFIPILLENVAGAFDLLVKRIL
jgi:hypothetical protein